MYIKKLLNKVICENTIAAERYNTLGAVLHYLAVRDAITIAALVLLEQGWDFCEGFQESLEKFANDEDWNMVVSLIYWIADDSDEETTKLILKEYVRDYYDRCIIYGESFIKVVREILMYQPINIFE